MPIQGINNNVNHPVQTDIRSRTDGAAGISNQKPEKKGIAPVGAEKEATKTLGPLKLASGGTITYSIHGDTVTRSKQSIDFQNSQNAASAPPAVASASNISKSAATQVAAPTQNVSMSAPAAAAPATNVSGNTATPQNTANVSSAQNPVSTSSVSTPAVNNASNVSTAAAAGNTAASNAISGSTKSGGSSVSNIGIEMTKAATMLKEGYSPLQTREKTGLSSQMINSIMAKDAKKSAPQAINRLDLSKN